MLTSGSPNRLDRRLYEVRLRGRGHSRPRIGDQEEPLRSTLSSESVVRQEWSLLTAIRRSPLACSAAVYVPQPVPRRLTLDSNRREPQGDNGNLPCCKSM